jgi:hypothetical protein
MSLKRLLGYFLQRGTPLTGSYSRNDQLGNQAMKRLLAMAVITLLAGSALADVAAAQNTPPEANPHPSTPAIANAHTNPDAPAVGANSFTKAQAKLRIEKAGYTNVSSLAKDKDGIWRGKANNGSADVPVALDYQGNVVPK